MRTGPRHNRTLPALAGAVALLAAYQHTAVRLVLRRLLGQPDTAALLVLAAIAFGWALWGWLLYATIRDTADRLHHAHSRLRMRVPLHAAATTIAGTLTLLLDIAGTAHVPPSVPHAATDMTTDRDDVHEHLPPGSDPATD
ncbi:hypothetical protein GCM10009827_119470 [Dactylosporangium maewongense]|uniref:Integral membrane protein n=1 Tax=Dactylosporangium maewongense TaxID=634393 RepID=A0ABP4PEM9_9ACTN